MNFTKLTLLIIPIFLFFTVHLNSQIYVEVDGQLKLGHADTVSTEGQIVVRKSDGILAVTDLDDLIPVETALPLPYTAQWEDYNVGFQKGTFYKHNDRVFLNGLVRKGGGFPDTLYSNIDTLCVLPEGYRPWNRVIVYGKHQSNNVRLNIKTDGTIWFVYGTESINWVSLDGVSFYRKEEP